MLGTRVWRSVSVSMPGVKSRESCRLRTVTPRVDSTGRFGRGTHPLPPGVGCSEVARLDGVGRRRCPLPAIRSPRRATATTSRSSLLSESCRCMVLSGEIPRGFGSVSTVAHDWLSHRGRRGRFRSLPRRTKSANVAPTRFRVLLVAPTSMSASARSSARRAPPRCCDAASTRDCASSSRVCP